jgi:hypothetical protein
LTGSSEPETCFEKDGVHMSFVGVGLLVHSLSKYGLAQMGKKTAPGLKAPTSGAVADNGLLVNINKETGQDAM